MPPEVRPILVFLRGAVGAGKTSVARLIPELCNDVRTIDVDELKIHRYGTSEKCCPYRDFPAAGAQAREFLDSGFHTFIIEAFAEKLYIDLCINETGRKLSDRSVFTVWLSCGLPTSLERKGGELSERTIRYQHARYAGRFRPKQEIEVVTDHLKVDRVARALVQALPLANHSGNEPAKLIRSAHADSTGHPIFRGHERLIVVDEHNGADRQLTTHLNCG